MREPTPNDDLLASVYRPVAEPAFDPVPAAKGDAEIFGHYQVMRREDGTLWELGRGAMGITYRAFDTNLRCPVALKVISGQHLHSETARERFIREARVAARLNHPNIATVFHLGTDPHCFFYSMEFVDGETLQDLLDRSGPLQLVQVLNVGLQTARALAAASRQGLIHRDIKPANLMVLRENADGDDELHVKVIDFGLARSYDASDSNARLTATGFVGTPLFASPEQLEEKDLDVRSDIYSLGITLWVLLTGNPPFEGKMTQVITQHLNAEPPWWQLGEIAHPARSLFKRMLKKKPEDRFQDAHELRRAIEECLAQATSEEVPPLAPPDPSPTQTSAAGALRLSRVPGEPPTGRLDIVRSTLGKLVAQPWKLALLCAVPLLIFLAFFAIRGNPTPETAPKPKLTVHITAVPSPVPSTPEPTASEPATPSPMPAATPTPPPLTTPAAAPADLALTDPQLRDSAVPLPTPTPSPAAGTPGPDEASTTASAKNKMEDNEAADKADSPVPDGSPARRTHHHAHATPTPKPNFFQRLFGLKPKPTPKKY